MSAAALAALPVEHVFDAMGTRVTILLPAERPDAARIAHAVFDAWEARFSRFQPDSELSSLNASAGSRDGFVASAALFGAIRVALDAARATDGLFDPLLAARLVELGYDRTFAEIEPSARATRLRSWTAGRWRQVGLDPSERRVHLPAEAGIDLGGIAKGMAVDAALAAIVATGVPWAAVNAGGDLAVHGLPPGTASWPVAVEGIGERVVAVREGALATSTVLERRWQVGSEWRHHLVDPRTGLPAGSGLALVSAAATTCTQAEVAAKVALLLGGADAVAFLQRHRLAGLIVADDGTEQRVAA